MKEFYQVIFSEMANDEKILEDLEFKNQLKLFGFILRTEYSSAFEGDPIFKKLKLFELCLAGWKS